MIAAHHGQTLFQLGATHDAAEFGELEEAFRLCPYVTPWGQRDLGRLLAAIHNTSPAPPEKPFDAEDFYPALRDEEQPVTRNTHAQLEIAMEAMIAAWGAI